MPNFKRPKNEDALPTDNRGKTSAEPEPNVADDVVDRYFARVLDVTAPVCNCRSATMGSTSCKKCQHDLGCPVHNSTHCRDARPASEQRTQKEVDRYLDAAVKENGYDELVTWDASEVAMDMLDNIAGYEDTRPSEILLYIRNWQQRNGGKLLEFSWRYSKRSRISVQLPEHALRDAGWTEVGRQLSVATKAMTALRGVIVAASRLRRFSGGESPIAEVLKGQLAAQESTELDKAIEEAAMALVQLEREYSKEMGSHV